MENGQILINSERCKIISESIKIKKCYNVVEIGTWKGLGSTICILNSINEKTNFISLEFDYNFYKIALSNLNEYREKVKLIYGTIIKVEDVLEHTKNFELNTTKKEWLNSDLNNLKNCPYVIDLIPQTIDFLLLDGGEFSTYEEYKKLKNRTSIIAIDDINELKSKLIYDELSKDEHFKLINKTEEGNGFASFIRI